MTNTTAYTAIISSFYRKGDQVTEVMHRQVSNPGCQATLSWLCTMELPESYQGFCFLILSHLHFSNKSKLVRTIQSKCWKEPEWTSQQERIISILFFIWFPKVQEAFFFLFCLQNSVRQKHWSLCWERGREGGAGHFSWGIQSSFKCQLKIFWYCRRSGNNARLYQMSSQTPDTHQTLSLPKDCHF